MALVEMTPRVSAAPGFEYTETIQSGQTGNDVHVFPLGHKGGKITCTMIAGAGSGKFQYTTSLDAQVVADTAVWKDWPKGSVTGTESDALLSQVTGLRGVSSSGEITIEIVY